MGTLKDTLGKLNKGKKEEDQVNVLGSKTLVRGVISTGSPYLDYVSGGGYLDGGYNTVCADGGVGKSSMALLACKDTIKSKNKYAVYFDGEATLNDSYIDRMGVDRNMLIVRQGRNLEKMLDEAEAFSTTDDVGIIIIDSLPIFVSSVVEDKTAKEFTMAAEAKRFAARMPIIEGNCVPRSIGIIGLTSYRKDPGSMGDPRYLSRGSWQITMNNTFLDLTRKEFLLDENKNKIGHKLDVRVKKTKNGTYNPKEVFDVNFYYDGGFNEEEEYTRLFVETGIAKQGGAWIKFPNKDGEEKSVNGKDKLIEHLKNNEEDYNFLKEQLNETV